MSELMSLSDLAGADVNDVAAVRFETTPIGVYGFECVEAALVEVGADDKPCVKFKLALRQVVKSESPKTEEELLKMFHTESIFIDRDNPTDGIGRIKAFIEDAQGDPSGIMGGADGKEGFVDKFVGHQFTAGIKHRPNKNDKDNPYANVFFTKAASGGDAEV